ncbi:MAG: efflux RND transporter periplasmic adaptor subunit [Gammaproteobacteria bacterium]
MNTKHAIKSLFVAAGLTLATVNAFAADAPDGTMLISLGGSQNTVPIGGTVVPLHEITMTAQFPGRVEFIAGKEGDSFQSGAVLVGMDEEELLAQRHAAEADIARAEAGLRDAKIQYQRELRSPNPRGGQGGMPFMNMVPFMGGDQRSQIDRRADIHSASTAIEQAEARLFQAESRLLEIDAKISDARSVAPFDGVILEKFANVGDTVQPGQPLVNFGDVHALQIQADLPVRMARSLSLGDLLDVRLDDNDKTVVKARVAQVFPKADTVRHTLRIKFDLPLNSPAAAGMYAEVLVKDSSGGQASTVPIIPMSAIVERGGLPMAYVQRPNGARELRLLRLGDRIGEDRVAVLTGLMPGELLVLSPKKH